MVLVYGITSTAEAEELLTERMLRGLGVRPGCLGYERVCEGKTESSGQQTKVYKITLLVRRVNWGG